MRRLVPSLLLTLVFGSSGCTCGGLLAEEGSPDAARLGPDDGDVGLETGAAVPDAGPCTQQQPCVVDLTPASPVYPLVGQVAVNGGDVYYVEASDRIMKVSVDGGPSTALVTYQPSDIGDVIDVMAVTARDLYWIGNEVDEAGAPLAMRQLERIAVDGGPSVTLLAGWPPSGGPGGLAIDSTSVYCAEDFRVDAALAWMGEIQKMPLQGGMPTLLASGPGFGGPLAVNATNVYWLANEPDTGDLDIMTVPIGGGSPATLLRTLSPGLTGPGAIAIDSTNLYVGAMAPSLDAGYVGNLVKIPLDGGAPVILATGDLTTGDPQYIVVDATTVYWTNTGALQVPANGSVMSVPIDGGTPTALSVGEVQPTGIAVDSTSVYWGSATGLWKRTPK